MASVWRARDEVLARTVAIKILHPHLSEDEQFLERFRREALAAARLSHPNIVSIYDTGTEKDAALSSDQHFIVMEYCDSGTLAGLQKDGPMEPERVIAIAGDICGALGYAHRSGIIHRDIKPANVLITQDGVLKVADFGIAKAAFGSGDITATGSILGTVTYLSPEQVRGDEPDARSDLYSLGILIYELLAGRAPFVEDSQIAVALKHVNGEPPSLGSLSARIPRGLDVAVMRALAKDPGERYESAEEMSSALGSATPGSSTTLLARPRGSVAPTRASESGPPLKRWAAALSQTRNLIPVAIVVALAIALGIFLPILFDSPNEGEANRGGGGNGNPGVGRAGALSVEAAHDLDPPPGDGEEHAEDVSSAFDGDADTYWETESYAGDLGKPGVGLVFDLGDGAEVDRVRVVTTAPGLDFEVRAGDEDTADADGFQSVDAAESAAEETDFDIEPIEARYWLVWVTGLPEGGKALLNEVQFFGS